MTWNSSTKPREKTCRPFVRKVTVLGARAMPTSKQKEKLSLKIMGKEGK